MCVTEAKVVVGHDVFGWFEVLRSALGKGIAEAVAFVLLAAVGLLLKAVWGRLRWLIDYHRRLRSVSEAVARETTSTGLREGKGVWLTGPITGASAPGFRDRFDASKVLVVANAKGGVGKTTTVANIGAYLAECLSKPVLLIDLDYQGTLSSMTVAGPHWIPPQGLDSRATALLSGDLDKEEVATTAQSAAGQPNLRIITAFYDLAQAENRLMIEWLIGDRQTDLRFRLASVLHSQAVRDAFSVVIIDCPPRITTATVQALAAGTHLLIPTVLDDPSAEAVVTFVREVERFKKANICPYIRYIGVAGSMEPPVGSVEGAIKRLGDRLKEIEYANGSIAMLPEETFLPRSVHFMNAVSKGGIAYLVMGNAQAERPVKERIAELADLVRKEMRL